MTMGQVRFLIIFLGGFLGGEVYGEMWSIPTTKAHLWSLPVAFGASALLITLLSAVVISVGKRR